MIFALDTSSPTCKMYLLEKKGVQVSYQWLAERRLAKELLLQIEKFLKQNKLDFNDLTGIVVFRGPGSFTGLRIGITVANTMSDSLNIPIVGEIDENWYDIGLGRILKGENDKIVLPEYGAPPHITKPKK